MSLNQNLSLSDTHAANEVAGPGLQHNASLMKCPGPLSMLWSVVHISAQRVCMA